MGAYRARCRFLSQSPRNAGFEIADSRKANGVLSFIPRHAVADPVSDLFDWLTHGIYSDSLR